MKKFCIHKSVETLGHEENFAYLLLITFMFSTTIGKRGAHNKNHHPTTHTTNTEGQCF